MNKQICLATLAVLAGCVATTPHYDARFGDAVRQSRIAMTINPNAAANPDPAAGIDGKAGQAAVVRYQDSFKAPPPVVNVINIGGVTGGAK
jgi:predicted component of type VI protein secretion system